VPADEMGGLAVEYLLHRVAGAPAREIIELRAEFVVRASTEQAREVATETCPPMECQRT
jgi:DNA-binding LacI/PurR family transcriptional regulator